MVIMEPPPRHTPIAREIFQKQLDVAVAQFGLVYPCLLKDRTVDLYKLYCLVWEIKLKTDGDFSYADNVEEWRRVAEEMGYMGDINAIVLFKIYNRYIAEGYEKSSSQLSGVPFPKAMPFSQKVRQEAAPRDSEGEMPRQKRVYRKRKDKDRSVLTLPPSITNTITPVKLNPSRYNIAPIRYNIHANKTFSTCTRPASPKVGGSRGSRGASPARGSAASPARGSRGASPSRGATPPVIVRTVDNIWDKTAQFRGSIITNEKGKVSGITPTREPVKEQKIPDGCVLEGKGSDSYIVDDGILPKPSGEPEKYEVNPVIRQLECGLPNEVQFGLNMLLWMTKSWALPLPKYPRLLPVLVANTGILDKATEQYWDDDGMCDFWQDTQRDSHFFNTGLQAQRTRAIQISVILGNLAHVESNAKFLLHSDVFMQYLVQCLSSSCVPIRNNGVEILAVLANQVELEQVPLFSTQVFQKLPLYLTSSDRFLVTSGLEVITSLCSIADNHTHLIDNLGAEQYQLICQLLLVPDVQLLHSALESMYSLTSLGLHPCEQFLSKPHILSTLVDLFSCTAERLEHRGVKVLRFVERKPRKLLEERNAAEWTDVRVTAAEIKSGSITQNQDQKSVDVGKVKGPVSFAERWVKQNLQFSPGSILLKCAVYNKYVKAVNARPGPQTGVVSPAELFTLLSNTFPGSLRQKISVGSTMKFVVKNMDWLKRPAQATSTSSDGQAYYMKIKSIGPKTGNSRPNTPITQFSTPKPEPSKPEPFKAEPPFATKVKINPLPLTDIADDAFKFVSERKEESEEEIRSSDDEDGEFGKKKRRKKKYEGAMIVAKIIVEELDQSDPKIIEECEDIDGRIVPEDNDFPNPPQSARIVKTYSAKRRLSGESPYTRPNNAFNRFNLQQPREYSQYKKTLMLDLSTTPEKKQRIEENAARAHTSKPTSPVFDTPNSPTYDRTFEKVVSPTFDKQKDNYSLKDDGQSPTFDRCSSPVFKRSQPDSKKIKSYKDEPTSSTFDQQGSPTFDKPGSPTFDKSESPTFDKPGSPTFDKPASPTFDKPGSPTFDKPGSPTFDKPGSPTFDKPGSPTFDKSESSTFDKPGSPTFDKPGSPTFNQPGSPTFDKSGSPTFEKQGSPTFDKPDSSIFEQQRSQTSEKTITNHGDQAMKQSGCKPYDSVSVPTPKPSSEVADHLNYISGSVLDDPAFSPLPHFQPDSSIFDRNSENSTGKSDKLKIDNDIFVSEAEVDNYIRPLTSPKKTIQSNVPVLGPSPQIINNPGNQRKILVSPVPDSRKTVLKTVVSNHQSGEPMSAVSLIPISIAGHINSRSVSQMSPTIQTMTTDPTTPNSFHNTVRLAKISPQKPNTQFVNTSPQYQVLVPGQQQNLMLVNQQAGSSQQMYVLPQSPQQRLIMSPPNSGAQQVLVLPHNQHHTSQQILLAPHNQGTAQQVFVSQPQQPSNLSGQPIFIATSGHNTGQPIIIAQQNQGQQSGHQVLLTSQSQTAGSHQFILAPQATGNPGQIILSQNQSTGPQHVFITQQSVNNGQVIMQTPNSGGQILIASQGQVPQGQVILSPQNNTRVLVLPQSQQTNNQVLLAPQQTPNNTVQQFVIGTQTSPPSSEPPSNQLLFSSAPVFINSAPNPVIISSQTGSPTKQILVPLSSSSFSGGRVSSVSSNTSVTTSCTTVYSEPVVCTAPGRYTYTLSPAKLSPIKMAHLSPLKLMTNGSGGTVALMSNNQQRVGGGSVSPQIAHVPGGKRPLTRIAPRPVPICSTALTVSSPATTTTTSTVERSAGSVPTTTSTPCGPSLPTERKRKLVLPPSIHSYPCHWKNCSGGFEREVDLRNHLLSKHVAESPTACMWATCSETAGARSRYSLIFHLKNIHARAPLLSHIPSCSYTREKVKLLLSNTLPWTDPRETPITKSLHLLIALIIRNMVFFTPELVGDVSRFEGVFAMIAMSSQEAGRVLTDVLALTSGITEESEEGVFITHLPPFR